MAWGGVVGLVSKCGVTLASVAAPPPGARQGFGGPTYPRHPSQVAVLHALLSETARRQQKKKKKKKHINIYIYIYACNLWWAVWVPRCHETAGNKEKQGDKNKTCVLIGN